MQRLPLFLLSLRWQYRFSAIQMNCLLESLQSLCSALSFVLSTLIPSSKCALYKSITFHSNLTLSTPQSLWLICCIPSPAVLWISVVHLCPACCCWNWKEGCWLMPCEKCCTLHRGIYYLSCLIHIQYRLKWIEGKDPSGCFGWELSLQSTRLLFLTLNQKNVIVVICCMRRH